MSTRAFRSGRRRDRLLWPLGLLLAGLLVTVTLLVATILTKAPAPEAGTSFRTLPPGSPLSSGEQCARQVRRSAWEPRPENATANHTMPQRVSLPDWTGHDPRANALLRPRVDGRFTGTTDEIIQWGACKWGIDEHLVRAIAVAESTWVQSKKGDDTNYAPNCLPGYSTPCPTSFGLLQIKHIYHDGTYPHSLQSTAFNVDYVLGRWRACYEGWVTYLAGYSRDYRAGDLWGCVGVHFSGYWKDSDANSYISRVRGILAAKPWVQWDG